YKTGQTNFSWANWQFHKTHFPVLIVLTHFRCCLQNRTPSSKYVIVDQISLSGITLCLSLLSRGSA
ncbi:hypothetical protein PMAYCL1PPCAC_13894, partial [Pristionchus mayeri]